MGPFAVGRVDETEDWMVRIMAFKMIRIKMKGSVRL